MSRPGVVLINIQQIPNDRLPEHRQRVLDMQHVTLGKELVEWLADAGAAVVHYRRTSRPSDWGNTTEYILEVRIEPLHDGYIIRR